MNETIKHYAGSILIFCVILVCMITFHEETHRKIAEYYDCYNIEVEWFTKEGNVAQTSFNCDDEDIDKSMLAHSINEIVGYNIMPILAMILFLIVYKRYE